MTVASKHPTKRSQMIPHRKSMSIIAFLALVLTLGVMYNSGQQHRALQSSTITHYNKNDNRRLRDTSTRSIGGSAIAMFTTSDDEDISLLCLALKSILFVGSMSSPKMKQAPVLIFNEGNLSLEQMDMIKRDCTHREVAFPVARINDSFPAGFDEKSEWEMFSSWTKFRVHPGRDKWSFSQITRFWTTKVWYHPAIQQYDTIMKFHSDSCFIEQRGPNENPGYMLLPYLKDEYVYQSNFDDLPGGNPHYIQGLYDFAVDYIRKEGIVVANPELWGVIEKAWVDRDHRYIPFFQNHLEICRREFFQRDVVAKWHEAISEQSPFGIFRKRWSDSHIRVFTMAMFATKESLFLTKSTGYLHGKGRCAKNFVSEIYDRLAPELLGIGQS